LSSFYQQTAKQFTAKNMKAASFFRVLNSRLFQEQVCEKIRPFTDNIKSCVRKGMSDQWAFSAECAVAAPDFF